MKAFAKKSSGGGGSHEAPPAPRQQQPERALSPTATDEFAARRSGRRISSKKFTADNDTWQENLAVVELNPDGGDKSKKSSRRRTGKSRRSQLEAGGDDAVPIGQLQVRSYFQSLATGQRVWDEPPSGASNVVYATEEVRRMAEIQMQDLVVSTEVVGGVGAREIEESDEKRGVGTGGGGEPAAASGGVLGRLKIGRRRSSQTEQQQHRGSDADNQPRERRRVTYKPGKAPYGATAAFAESALDRDTQVAIMLSMNADGRLDSGTTTPVGALSPRSASGALSPFSGGESASGGAEEGFEAEIAMAKAMSLSEAMAAKADLSPIAPPSMLTGRKDLEEEEGAEERQLRMAMELSMRTKIMDGAIRTDEGEEEFLRAATGGGGSSREVARPSIADGRGGSQRSGQEIRHRGSSARGLSSSSGMASPRNAALAGRNPFDDDDDDQKMPATTAAAAAAHGEEEFYEYPPPPPSPSRARAAAAPSPRKSNGNVPYGFKTKWDNKHS